MTTFARRDAKYRIGEPSAEMVEVPNAVCVCGAVIVPLLGKVREGTILDWSVWIKGAYEHVERPAYPHAAVAS